MKTITYNKLIRDRIPEIIEASGKTAVVEQLTDDEFLQKLDERLFAGRVRGDTPGEGRAARFFQSALVTEQGD
jgi:hypothetical protein